MGALSSRMMLFRGRRAPEEQGAASGAEEVVAVDAAVVRQEEGEEAQLTTSQRGRKRRNSRGGPLAKTPRREHAKDKSWSLYEALFLRGEGSDIRIRALGEEWSLHRIYLSQSGYFASMFSGAWQETNMDTIEIQVPDENIDRESLNEVLSSLYHETIIIPPSRVIAILATASMLQLDELIQQCGEIMKDTVSAKTVCSYVYSAENYGLQNIRAICIQWLLDNLMTHTSEELLLEVSIDLMKELIASSDLLVMEGEMDVYSTLKKWMFLQLQPTWRGPQRTLLSDANLWFAGYRRESEGAPFLETEQGRVFMPVFQQLRLGYILCDLSSAHVIDQDALIPATWLTPIYKEQWLSLLLAEQTREPGPMNVLVSDLQGNSMRCGGQLRRDEKCSWRWAGLNFVWDLVVCYTNRRIIFRRNVQKNASGLGISLIGQRKIAFRLRLVSLDRVGRAIFRKDTKYQILCLRKDQELEVVNLNNQDLIFPIYLSYNFLYLAPENSTVQREEPCKSLGN